MSRSADGLTILAANPQVAMAQLFKVPAVRFDVRQFIWIGSSGADAALLAIHPSPPYKTFKDLRNAKEELVFGSTGPGSNSHDVPFLLKEFAGAKFKMVSGYAANSDIKLALERREVDGWTALGATIRIAGRAGHRASDGALEPHADPGLIIFPSTRIWRPAISAARSWTSAARRSRSDGRSACGPARRPTASPCCGSRCRKALADPKFLAEMKNAQIEIGHIGADDVTKAFNAMINQPPEVLDVDAQISQGRRRLSGVSAPKLVRGHVQDTQLHPLLALPAVDREAARDVHGAPAVLRKRLAELLPDRAERDRIDA